MVNHAAEERAHFGAPISESLCSESRCWCWAEDRAKRESSTEQNSTGSGDDAHAKAVTPGEGAASAPRMRSAVTGAPLSSNHESNRDKVLRREVVEVTDSRLLEMQEITIREEGWGLTKFHWHFAAVINELIARRKEVEKYKVWAASCDPATSDVITRAEVTASDKEYVRALELRIRDLTGQTLKPSPSLCQKQGDCMLPLDHQGECENRFSDETEESLAPGEGGIHDSTRQEQRGLMHPIETVWFRAGLLACRAYMAAFVEQGGHRDIADSIRANWWPSLGVDPGAPRQNTFQELTEGEYGEPGFRVRKREEVSPSLEALPVALMFLQGHCGWPHVHRVHEKADANRNQAAGNSSTSMNGPAGRVEMPNIPAPPPVDNAHVADGCEKFSEKTNDTHATGEPDVYYGKTPEQRSVTDSIDIEPSGDVSDSAYCIHGCAPRDCRAESCPNFWDADPRNECHGCKKGWRKQGTRHWDDIGHQHECTAQSEGDSR